MQPSNHLTIKILFLSLFASCFLFLVSAAHVSALQGDTPIGCSCGNNLTSITKCCTNRCGYRTSDPAHLGMFICSPVSNGTSATTEVTGTPLGNIEGLGPLGTIITLLSANNVAPASNKLAGVISVVIGVITIVAGIWFMIKILISGFNIISSSGDKNKMQEAQHAITNSVIGLTVVVAAYALTSLFGKILGIPDILNLGNIIQQLGPKTP